MNIEQAFQQAYSSAEAENVCVVDTAFKRYTWKAADACIYIKFFYWVSKYSVR